MSNTLTPNTVTPASPPEPVVQGQPRPNAPPLWPGRAASDADKRAALLLFLLACAGAALTLVPFYLMLALSLKTDEEVAQSPWALPHVPQWINYVRAWTIEGTERDLRRLLPQHPDHRRVVHGWERCCRRRWSPSASRGCAFPAGTGCSRC